MNDNLAYLISFLDVSECQVVPFREILNLIEIEIYR